MQALDHVNIGCEMDVSLILFYSPVKQHGTHPASEPNTLYFSPPLAVVLYLNCLTLRL